MEVGYRVVGQRPVRVVMPSGALEPGFAVTFELDSGDIGEVEVPERIYSEGAARALIQDKAQAMAAVRMIVGVVNVGEEG